MLWEIVFVIIQYASITILLLRFTDIRCKSKACLVGKVALVTGGNKGIGYETSIGLASRGCKVIIVCRSDAEKERQEIISKTGNSNVVVMRTDLSSMVEVRKLASDLKKKESKLDILINNAVLVNSNPTTTSEGLDETMAASLFGPFLLTCLLIGLLKKSDDGRIVFLSSVLIWGNNLTLENLNGSKQEKSFMSAFRAYSNTKLGILIISNVFAEKLKPFGISVNAVHPGAVNTGLWQSLEQFLGKNFPKLVYVFNRIFYKDCEEGAQASLIAATDVKYRNSSGNLIWDFPLPSPGKARDQKFCKQIWEGIEKYVKLTPDERLYS